MHDDERFGGPTPDGSVPAQGQPSAEVLSSSEGLVLSAPSILADGGAPLSEPRSRKRGIAMAAAAVLVLGVGAGAFAVGSALSGGGAQPESVVPASAVFYAEVDLDPSAGQKVDAFRFLRKFPQLKDTFTADGGFGPGFAKLFDGSSVDYAKDVEPWLGKRYAVALVPGASKDQLRLELVVQVTDEKAATTSLEALVGKAGLSGAGVVVRDGYAIIAVSSPGAISADGGAPTGAAAQISAEAEAANLESSTAYTSAIAPYGSGVVTVWSDNGGFSTLASTLTGGLGGGLGGFGGLGATPSTGYSVSVLHFDGDTLELAGSTTGSTTTLPSGGVPAFFTLPDSTLAAVGGSGVGRAMKDAVAPYLKSLGSLAMLGGGLSGATGATPTTSGLSETPRHGRRSSATRPCSPSEVAATRPRSGSTSSAARRRWTQSRRWWATAGTPCRSSRSPTGSSSRPATPGSRRWPAAGRSAPRRSSGPSSPTPTRPRSSGSSTSAGWSTATAPT